MAREIIFLVEEAPEGGYVARALDHSIFTEADTWDELKQAIRDATRCHFDEADPDEVIQRPMPYHLDAPGRGAGSSAGVPSGGHRGTAGADRGAGTDDLALLPRSRSEPDKSLELSG
jgi:hypothetical protein